MRFLQEEKTKSRIRHLLFYPVSISQTRLRTPAHFGSRHLGRLPVSIGNLLARLAFYLVCSPQFYFKKLTHEAGSVTDRHHGILLPSFSSFSERCPGVCDLSHSWITATLKISPLEAFFHHSSFPIRQEALTQRQRIALRAKNAASNAPTTPAILTLIANPPPVTSPVQSELVRALAHIKMCYLMMATNNQTRIAKLISPPTTRQQKTTLSTMAVSASRGNRQNHKSPS